MKTITIEDKQWKRLARLKMNLGLKTYSEVLDKLFNLITKFKLAGELKEEK